MAERRMFSKQIIDSDAFLEMPLSAQCLYFHLSMRADDDGFLNNAKKIQRIIGASGDDLKILFAKRFLLAFDDGIVVIKHWRIHNYIRGDRKKETVYVEEMAMLETKENGVYSFRKELPEMLGVKDKEESSRRKAYRESELPYSFEYKIRQAFTGKPCPICGALMQADLDEGIITRNRIPTIQHNTPISKGGRHELGNISVICHQCNVTIKDTETDDLNAAEVIEVWEQISSDSQASGRCQADVSQNAPQDSIDKNRVEEDSISSKGNNNIQLLNNIHRLCKDIDKNGNVFQEVKA